MVEVTFIMGHYGFETMKLVGHADYNPGNDVVCAGISALSQALVGTLQNINAQFRTKTVESGNIFIEIDPFSDESAQKVVDTVFLTCLVGLLQIEKQYPDHIKIDRKFQ